MEKATKRIICLLLFIVLCSGMSYSSAYADTITLPAQLLTVGKEAFYGDASITEVVIPNGTETIGEKAFADSGLKCIHIPDTVRTIENDVFSGCEKLIIWCRSDSYARNFADEHGITWVDISVYSVIIEKYREAYESGNANDGVYSEKYAGYNDISPWIGYYEHVGYALHDLDNNGVPELIVAGISATESAAKRLFDLYTISEGSAENIATSWIKQRYHLRRDNTILFDATGGASYKQYALKKIFKGELIPIEAIFTYDTQDFNNPDNGHYGYYYQTGYTTYEPNENSIEIDEETYFSKRDEYESMIYMPPLTLIA